MARKFLSNIKNNIYFDDEYYICYILKENFENYKGKKTKKIKCFLCFKICKNNLHFTCNKCKDYKYFCSFTCKSKHKSISHKNQDINKKSMYIKI